MTRETFQVAVPLYDFPWRGTSYTAPGEFEIIDSRPKLGVLEKELSPSERGELWRIRHWLVFDWVEGDEPTPSETVTLFLLALWLTKPTKSRAQVLFSLNKDAEKPNHGMLRRFLDRFRWIDGHFRSQFSDMDLNRAVRYFSLLKDVSRSNARLRQALALHAAGCRSSHWHVSFICHCAALETILTYERGPGITRRLSKSFACLTRRTQRTRNGAFVSFRKLYSLRSDINHGGTIGLSHSQRLGSLAKLETACREIWRQILSSGRAQAMLEGSDAQRAHYYRRLEQGYTPPR